MKFKIKISSGRNEWSEEYDKPEVLDVKEAEQFGREIIDSFNHSLRPGEKPREFVSAEIIGPSKPESELDRDDVINLVEAIEDVATRLTTTSQLAKDLGAEDIHRELENAWATVDLQLEEAKSL
jgi:hypothetical protein